MFFHEVQRSRSPPFYQHVDLIAKIPDDEDISSNCSVSDDEFDYQFLEEDIHDDVPPDTVIDTDEETIETPSACWTEKMVRFMLYLSYTWRKTDLRLHLQESLMNKFNKAIQLIEEQLQAGGNVKFLEVMERETKGLDKMLENIDRFQRRRTFPTTWSDKNKYTMYMKLNSRN